MSSYNVNSGDTITIDETLTDTIDYINVNDGVCNITNSSETGLVLAFASSGYLSVKAFGQLNVRGKMKELGVSDGSRGFSLSHWQTEHPINVIWVEDAAGSGNFLPWYGINTTGSTLLDFSDFADSVETGRVFKWTNGVISFSPTAGEAFVPENGCKIQAPNIIFSTVTPFGSTTTAKIIYDEGGFISIKDASFSDFSGTLKGIGHLDLERVGLYGSAYIQYCNDLDVKDTHAGIKDNYASGLNFSYSSNGVVDNVSGMTTKSKGVTFNYLKNFNATGVTGQVAKRDSTSDNPVVLLTVQGSTISEVKCIGGGLLLDNVSASRVEDPVTIDSTLLVENSTKATSNLVIVDSSDVVVRNWIVPTNGGAKLSYLSVKNSPGVDVIKSRINSSFATAVISADVSFDSRISEIDYDGYTGSSPFEIPSKNNGMLLQNVTGLLYPEIDASAPNMVIKGAQASGIKSDIANTPGTNFAQTYTNPTNGEIIFMMAPDSLDTSLFSERIGNVKNSNNGRLYFELLGDSITMTTPYRVKGVDFIDSALNIEGYGLGAIAFDYSIDTGNGFSNFVALTSANLAAEAIVKEDGFMLKIRATSGTISGTTYLSKISLPTSDDRYVYPLDFETGVLVFDENAVLDEGARYFVYYTDGYGTVDSVLVRDADGQPLTGLINGQSEVEFSYDFSGDDSNGRTVDEPFGITVVVGGLAIAKNTIISQVFDRGQVNVFNLRPEKEYGYLGA